MRLDGGQHGLEALGVACDHVALLEEFVATGKVAHQAAGFLDQQGPCGHVPLGQAEFPEGIEATGRDIGEVQAGGAGAADAGGLAHQAAEHAQVVVEVVQLGVAEGEAGAEQGAFQALARADAQAATVERGAAAAAGGEFFLAYRIEDHGVLQAALVLAGDAHGVVRNAADEVGGAIQRIDDPQVVGAFALAFQQATFFAEDAVVRVGLAQGLDNGELGSAVDLGDVVLGVLLIDGDNVQAFDRAENQFTGAASGAQGDIQHRLHGEFTWVVKEESRAW
ncbi:hypothetical protein D3C85_1008550 [compost metagenome]